VGEERLGGEASAVIYLNIIVEGQTEETFVRDMLAPHWGAMGIFAVARCVETGRKSKRIFRGGVTNYEKIRRDIENWLNQRKDTYCTTMFDLYRLPMDFPGRNSINSNQQAYEKVKHLENAFGENIATTRFIPYIQLHEFETLLFAGIDKLSVFYLKDKHREIERLITMSNSYDSPELINESEENAPSKRIIKEIPNYKDNKVLIGPAVAQATGLQLLRQRCTHFNDWMDRIESLIER
jgi:hypothetical protein